MFEVLAYTTDAEAEAAYQQMGESFGLPILIIIIVVISVFIHKRKNKK